MLPRRHSSCAHRLPRTTWPLVHSNTMPETRTSVMHYHHTNLRTLVFILFFHRSVIYVGEWEGFTATQDFEVKLQKDYVLVEKMQLPNWSDSAYFLSIWKLKSSVPKKEAKSNISVIECSKCHAKATPDTKLYKCRFCRVRLYCGPVREKLFQSGHSWRS
jgi:hypothetical protein